MMRGNRPFQPNRPLGARAGMAVPPALVEANRRFQAQDYLGAAQLYETVVERAKVNHPRHVPRLLIQAGRARILGGQVDQGFRLMKNGLQVLAGQERWEDLRRFGLLVVDGLQQAGLTQQATEVQEWLQQKIGYQGAVKPKVGMRAPLPDKCPQCGGTVDPREVEWVSDDTVECAYCGSLVRGREG
jgi:hypothetical protein